MRISGFNGSTRLATSGFSSATTSGATVTAPGSINTKGAWAAIGAGSPAGGPGFLVDMLAEPGSGDNTMLVDIGYGGSGAQVVIVPNLILTRPTSAVGIRSRIYIPVGVGTDVIWMRWAGSAVSPIITAQVTVFADSGFMAMPGMKATDYGTTTASSKGTDVDPGGTANTKGSYAQLTAALTNACRGIILQASFYQSLTAAGSITGALDLAIGGAGSEQIVLPNFLFGTGSVSGSAAHNPYPSIFLPISLPVGARLSARMACNVNTASTRVATVSVIGLH